MVAKPCIPIHFHQIELVAVFPDFFHSIEASFCKRRSGTVIPTQGMEVDPLDARIEEYVAEYGVNDIPAIALIPVIAITDHDPEFGLPFALVNIVVHHIANVFAVERIDRQSNGPGRRIIEFIPEITRVFGQREPQWGCGVQFREFRIDPPPVIGFGVLDPLFSQYGQLPLQT